MDQKSVINNLWAHPQLSLPGRLGALANVQHAIAKIAADASADTDTPLMMASCLALDVATGDEERSEPADERSTAKQVEVGAEARGAQWFGIHYSSTSST